MNRKTYFALAGLSAIVLALGVAVVAFADTDIRWRVAGSGGNQAGSTNYVARSTAGQSAAIGQSGSANFALGAGYWPGVGLDTDGDGCTGVEERGLAANIGGTRRDNNFWDFFDTPALPSNARDKAVSVGDINRIVGRFGSARPGGPPDKATALAEALSAPPPAPAYHASYDRTAAGVLTGPPDGAVATQDINRAVQQFGHSCIGPPN